MRAHSADIAFSDGRRLRTHRGLERRADDGHGGETESRPPDAALRVTSCWSNLSFQRDLHGLGWIPADQGNDGDDTGRPSRHPCVASHHLRHSRASRPRPGDLSPLSRKECRGSTRGRVACSHHSREACPRGSGERESTNNEEVWQLPSGRESMRPNRARERGTARCLPEPSPVLCLTRTRKWLRHPRGQCKTGIA